ncbi:hypothetical protein Tco_0071415 [Tanacetum coccineum]
MSTAKEVKENKVFEKKRLKGDNSLRLFSRSISLKDLPGLPQTRQVYFKLNWRTVMLAHSSTGTLSIAPIRDERVTELLKELVQQRLYKDPVPHPGFSKIAKPMTKLTQKKVNVCVEAINKKQLFSTVKQKLCDHQTLHVTLQAARYHRILRCFKNGLYVAWLDAKKKR